MPLSQNGRDVLLVTVAGFAATVLFWVALLMIHPTSNFVLEIKLLFHIP